MTKTNTTTTASGAARKPRASKPIAPGNATSAAVKTKAPTRSAFLIDLMRTETGETAHQLAEAVGWQVHSVRGFISGTLKKRTDLTVIATKVEGVTRYTIRDVVDAAND